AVFAAIMLAAACFLSPAAGFSAQAAPPVTVNVTNAVIQGANVLVQATTGAVPASDDGLYHLIAQEVYQAGAVGTEVAQAPAAANANFVFPLNKNTPSSNLFKKFTVCVKQGGVLHQVSGSRYITNPEACAGHTVGRSDGGKKGILPASALIGKHNGLKDLGIKQCTYNVLLGSLCSGSGIPFTYNGKTYQFNAGIVAQYDYLVPILNAQGIQLTFILLNNRVGDLTLIHPAARGAACNYYAFNTADAVAVERLEAAAAFLAQRYSNTGHGKVDNWVVGNEVNARGMWHYLNTGDINVFTAEYVKAFRLFYNAIKSENGNARVYTCIDQQWARASSGAYFGGQAFLTTFNAQVVSEGNIDWHLAAHPYNVPLTSPLAWANNRYITFDQASPYITMQNVAVLTDFMCQPAFKAPNGQVRSIILSEVGYTSTGGEQYQAASITYAYLQAQRNQHIDAFILAREMDDGGEIAQGLANGILNTGRGQKLAYQYYKHIDGPNAANYIAQTAAVMGVADINQVLTPR
ncbi:MAG: hypothetical protein IJR58_07155, partial [Lachnospiraceae bacterium]|nr:hypothetical protein [Lachnospiraceae bacterium]